RHSRERSRLVRLAGPAWAHGPAVLLGERTGEETRRASRARRHHGEGADRRVRWRDAGRASVLRLSAGRGIRGDTPGGDGRYPPRFRYAEPVRLLHRVGGDRDPLRSGPRDRGSEEPDPVLL